MKNMAMKNAEWESQPSTVLHFSFPVLYSSFTFRPKAPSLTLPRSTGRGNRSATGQAEESPRLMFSRIGPLRDRS
jgi:hypothetical protein